VLNPLNENVTTYAPGGSSVSRYCPVPSVTALLAFSISAGLDASTVTPGRTAPDESLTTPASVACANTDAGTAASQRKRHAVLFTADIDPPTLRFRAYGVRPAWPIGGQVERSERSYELQKPEHESSRTISAFA